MPWKGIGVNSKEAYEIWVAALKSGEYQQAQWALSDGDGYCASAVLLLKVMGEKLELGECTNPLQDPLGWNTSDNTNVMPNMDRLDWMGLTRQLTGEEWERALFLFDSIGKDPINEHRTFVTRLDIVIQMCDAGISFAEIADFIEDCDWAGDDTREPEVSPVPQERPDYISTIMGVLSRRYSRSMMSC